MNNLVREPEIENKLIRNQDEGIKLIQNKPFLFLLLSSVFSSLGASMFLFTQSWYIVRVLNLEVAVGIVMIGSSVPQIILLFLGGVIADRWNKTLLMFWSDITRVLLLSSIVLYLFFFPKIPIYIFVIYAIIFGVLSAFFYPARDSLIPLLVKEKDLTKANSVIQATNQGSMIIGPLICGLLITHMNYLSVFSIVTIILAIGAISISFIDKDKSILNSGAEDNNEQNIKKDLLAGIKYVRKSSILFGLVIISVLINLVVVGPLFMGLPIFVKSILQGSALDYSLIEGSLSVGLLIGSVMLFIVNIKMKRGKLALISLIFLAINYFLFTQTTVIWTSMLATLLVGIFIQTTALPVVSIIQNNVEKEFLGRVMSLLSISAMGLTPISYGITSVLLYYNWSIRNVMLFSSLIFIIITIIIFMKAKNIKEAD